MVEIKNMLQLQTMCSNIVKEVLEEIIEEYRNELADFIKKDVYSYPATWDGRTGEFGENIDKNYKINRKGSQYYRSMEIEITDNPMSVNYETGSHGATWGGFTYEDMFHIIENGFDTSVPPPYGFPSHMSGRLFLEDFRNHVKDTLKGRFAAKCIEKGIPSVIAGSIIVE
jgi:hypothetical protein